MQHSLEGLLVALLVALNPLETEAPTFTPEDNQQTAQHAPKAAPAPLKMDSDACRAFADPIARRNCAIRTNRVLSGSAEPSEFPAQTVWLVPSDPGMPFRFKLPGGPR